MRLAVRNTDDRNLPEPRGDDRHRDARRRRPGGRVRDVGDRSPARRSRPADLDRRSRPRGRRQAATNTWAVGPIFPGETRELEWRLTAVRPGNYRVNYSVAPGLHGRAVPANGQNTTGSFRVRISDEPVPARVNRRGEVVRGD